MNQYTHYGKLRSSTDEISLLQAEFVLISVIYLFTEPCALPKCQPLDCDDSVAIQL